jgi:hypothetical protein
MGKNFKPRSRRICITSKEGLIALTPYFRGCSGTSVMPVNTCTYLPWTFVRTYIGKNFKPRSTRVSGDVLERLRHLWSAHSLQSSVADPEGNVGEEKNYSGTPEFYGIPGKDKRPDLFRALPFFPRNKSSLIFFETFRARKIFREFLHQQIMASSTYPSVRGIQSF